MRAGILKNVFFDVIPIAVIFIMFFIILGVWRIDRLAFKMTNQIIALYETLFQINMNRKNKKKAVMQLSFKYSSKEINQLHLTFNAVARTLNLASMSLKKTMSDEELSMALLSYADAYKIFEQFGEESEQKGICLANIGSIMLQKGDYIKAMQYYKKAEESMFNLINQEHDLDLEDAK